MRYQPNSPHRVGIAFRNFIIAILVTVFAVVMMPEKSEARVIVKTRVKPVKVVRVKKPAHRRTVVVVKTPVVKVKVVKPVQEKNVWVPGHFRKINGRKAVWVPGHWKTI